MDLGERGKGSAEGCSTLCDLGWARDRGLGGEGEGERGGGITEETRPVSLVEERDLRMGQGRGWGAVGVDCVTDTGPDAGFGTTGCDLGGVMCPLAGIRDGLAVGAVES